MDERREEGLQVLRAQIRSAVPPAHLSRADLNWEALSEPWRVRTVEAGEILTRSGEVESYFSIILDGTQRVYLDGDAGEEVTVAFAYRPDPTGIPDSVLLGTPSAHTLVAVTDGAMLSVPRRVLHDLLDAHAPLNRWLWRLLAAALQGRARRERELLTTSAAERYDRFLRESGHLLQHVPLKHIASYLGMTPETLSRVRSNQA